MTDSLTRYSFKVAAIIIFVIWLTFFLGVIWVASDLKFAIPPSMELQALNNFGSSFNVLTSLFTGLAFAGVIISIRLQSAELKTAISVFEGQKNALQNQELDNKFFQMLHFFAEVKRNIKCCIDDKIYSGNDVFEPLLKKLLDTINIKYRDSENKDILKIFKEEFAKFNNEYDAVKYYFLNLYQILNYIKSQPVDEVNSRLVKLYTNMLRAQLSKNELILLAYNSIGVQAFTNDNYQILVEEYAFFEHLRLDDFLDDNADKQKIIVTILNIYADKVFGDNQGFIQKKQECYDNYYGNSQHH